MESLGQVLKGAPTEGFIVLLGDFKAHVGNESVTWKGPRSNSLPELNPSGGLFGLLKSRPKHIVSFC